MNQPKWVKEYMKTKIPVKQQITIVGRNPIMNTGTGADGVLRPGNPTGIHPVMNRSGIQTGNAMLDEGEKVISNAQINAMGGSANVDKIMTNSIINNRYKCGGNVFPFKRYAAGGILGDEQDRFNDSITPATSQTFGLAPGQTPISREQRDALINDPHAAEKNTPSTSQTFGILPGQQPITRTQRDTLINDPHAAEKYSPSTSQTFGMQPGQAPITREQRDTAIAALKTPIQTTKQTFGTGLRSTRQERDALIAARQPITPPAPSATNYQGTADYALSNMVGIMNGDSKVNQAMTNIGWQRLNTQAQSNLSVTAMQIANNPNLTQGMKNSMMASAMRDAGLAQSDFAAQMLIDNLTRSEAATGKVFDMAQSQEKMAQARQQFGANMADADWNSATQMINDGATFEQVQARFPNFSQEGYDNVRRYGAPGTTDYTRLSSLGSSQLAAGNITGFGKTMTLLFGQDFDVSHLQDIETTTTANTALGTIANNIALGYDDINNPMNDKPLMDLYSSMTGDKSPTIEKARDWAAKNNIFSTLVGSGSPFAAITELRDEDMASYLGVSSLANFTFTTKDGKVLTGRPAADFAFKSLYGMGGLKVNSDGTLDIDYEAWNAVFGDKSITKIDPDTGLPVTRTADNQGRFEMVEADDIATTWGTAQDQAGIDWIKLPYGTIQKVSDYMDDPNFDADPRFQNKATGEQVILGNYTWIKNGTTWNTIEDYAASPNFSLDPALSNSKPLGAEYYIGGVKWVRDPTGAMGWVNTSVVDSKFDDLNTKVIIDSSGAYVQDAAAKAKGQMWSPVTNVITTDRDLTGGLKVGNTVYFPNDIINTHYNSTVPSGVYTIENFNTSNGYTISVFKNAETGVMYLQNKNALEKAENGNQINEWLKSLGINN